MIRKCLLVAACLLLMVAMPASATVLPTGAISVISSPPNADVYVDDVFVGMSDNAFADIHSGDRVVKVVKAGYNEYIQTVYVSGGQNARTVPIYADFTRSTTLSGLVVDTNPEGAEVYVDDVFVGTTHYGGLQIADLAQGMHTIRIVKDGYKPYVVTDFETIVGTAAYLTGVSLIKVATVEPTATESAAPATGPASLVLDTVPTNSPVYLNGEFFGYTPQTITGLDPGTYTVLINRTGYTSWQTTLALKAGDVIAQNVTLTLSSVPTSPTKSPLMPATVFGGVLLAFGLIRIFKQN